jgi:hypothetical protein
MGIVFGKVRKKGKTMREYEVDYCTSFWLPAITNHALA